MIVAISGDAALHVLQQTWRGAEPADFADRLEALMAIPLCQAARRPEPCP